MRGARDVIEAGADGLVHLFVDRSPDSEFGRFVAEHQAFVIPTLTALESSSGIPSGASLITDAHLSPYLSETDVINLKQASPVPPGVKLSYTAAEEALQQLKDAKVPIVAGTDAPSPGTAHGPSLHRELELLVQAGLTPMEVLAATTSVPATVFHLNEPGTHRARFAGGSFACQGQSNYRHQSNSRHRGCLEARRSCRSPGVSGCP